MPIMLPDIQIARHVSQMLWHEAMHHTPKGLFGLLGEAAGGLIDRAVTSVTGAPADTDASATFIRNTLATWQQGGIQPRGAVYGTRDARLFAMVEKTINNSLPSTVSPPLVHIVISLDTEGRLDSEAYILSEEKAVSTSLTMVEDGQTADIR